MLFIAGYYSIDIYQNIKICINGSHNLVLCRNYIDNVIKHQNWAAELTIDCMLAIGNRLSFPQLPSKIQLPLSICEIIVLKDKQLCCALWLSCHVTELSEQFKEVPFCWNLEHEVTWIWEWAMTMLSLCAGSKAGVRSGENVLVKPFQ